MSFVKYADLESRVRRSNFSESVILKNASLSSRGKDIFLSHSHKDNQYVAGVIEMLREFNASVYADLDDSSLPETPSPATAQIIHSNITSCRRTIILISPASYDSKWIPWELGLSDGLRGMKHTAILPINQSGTEEIWARREYIGLYPLIAQPSEWISSLSVTNLPGGRNLAFADWLKLP